MRLAYVCADQGVPVFGHKGCSIHVQEVVRSFRRLGGDVELFASRTDGVRPSGMGDVRLHQLPSAGKCEVGDRERACQHANGALHSSLKREGPFDLVYERYSLWSFAAMHYARTTNVPGVLEVNAPLIEEQAEHRGLVNRDAAEGIRERVFRDASAIVAVSEEVADYVARFVREEDKISVFSNGVDPQRFPDGLAPALEADPGTFTIGFVGTLKPWHGVAHLLGAFERLYVSDHSYRLLIVGDGPERINIERRINDRALGDAVHLTGCVDPVDIPSWLASMDVGVAPYPANQNSYFSPLKVYEYMAARLPVVASRVGQLETLVDDGVTGMLVPAGDPIALGEALSRLRGDQVLRRRLATSARTRVVEKHTWDSVVRRILAIANPENRHRSAYRRMAI